MSGSLKSPSYLPKHTRRVIDELLRSHAFGFWVYFTVIALYLLFSSGAGTSASSYQAPKRPCGEVLKFFWDYYMQPGPLARLSLCIDVSRSQQELFLTVDSAFEEARC